MSPILNILKSRALISQTTRQVLLRSIRQQSTSTLGASSTSYTNYGEITSTSSYDKKEFSTAVEADYEYQHFDVNSIVDGMRSALKQNFTNQVKAVGVDIEISQVPHVMKQFSFDKVLLVVGHGEVADESLSEDENSKDCSETQSSPKLSGKGMGQMLNVSRTTAAFCNKETGLQPELVVVSPTRYTTESAIIAFPTYAPGSVNEIPWLYHHGCDNKDDSQIQSTDYGILSESFPGINNSLVTNKGIGASNERDGFLSWLKTRSENVIVVSSDSKWFQRFFNESVDMFDQYGADGVKQLKEGEIRSIGIKFP